jgi:catechol 2,3-dioxygenase-like lactoylglutathione lyase family enzyme
MMIRGIHHTTIATGDADRLLHFYRDLLGFKEIFRLQIEGEEMEELAEKVLGLKNVSAREILLNAGNTVIEIWQYTNPPGKPGDPNVRPCDHGLRHICLDVTDIHGEYERLKAAGMTFNSPPQDIEVEGGTVRAAYGRDPDGNIVEIQEVLYDESPLALDVFKRAAEPES